MSRVSELTIGVALVIAMGCGMSNAVAQTDKYPKLSPVDQYLMEKNAEILRKLGRFRRLFICNWNPPRTGLPPCT